MTNIATALKSEISRIARKEARSETAAVKKASSSYRTDIAALRRCVQELEQLVRKLAKAVPRPEPRDPAKVPSGKLRFSAKGLAAQRKRLGLSAHDCGRLVGASSQSIYNWEAEGARPQARHLPAIALLRTLGKKEAVERLITLQSAAK